MRQPRVSASLAARERLRRARHRDAADRRRARRGRADRGRRRAATYIDFAGGLGCQNTGHGFPPAVAAIHEQIDRYLHQCSMVGMYEPYVEVCRRLAELSPCAGASSRASSSTRGAEAVENAVKIARAATGRPGVVVFEQRVPRAHAPDDDDDAQGRPTSRASARSRPRSIARPGPTRTAESRRRLDRSARRTLRRARIRVVACVVLEPVQGEGGFIEMPDDFPARLAELCHERGILYVDDEVQIRRRAHGARLGDRALRRRAGPARLGQVARRRAAARRRDRPRRGDGCAAPRRARRDVRREPGRLRRGARRPRRGRDGRLPRAGGRARRADPHDARGARVARRSDRRGARARPDARDRARRRPRHEGAGSRTRQADHDAPPRARSGPALLRDARQRRSAFSSRSYLRRGSRPGSRDPGGVACRRSRAADVRLEKRPTSGSPISEGLRRGRRGRRHRPGDRARASSSRCSGRPARARRRRCG